MKHLIWKTYLKTIENSVGSKEYRNFYVEIDGKEKDVLEDGLVSCAYYVSHLLYRFNLIQSPHATVKSTVLDLEQFSWEEVDLENKEVGDILVWEEKQQANGKSHKHIGFYVGKDTAISHTDTEKAPTKHSDDYNGERKIEKVLRYMKK